MSFLRRPGSRRVSDRTSRARGTHRIGAGLLGGLVALGTLTSVAGPAAAADPGAAVISDAGCTTSTLGRNDDGSSPGQALPFELNFFGTRYRTVFVNNNGNLTFNAGMSTYTPFQVTASTPPIIAAFLADVDTTNAASGITAWGTTTFDGRPTFCANWRNVGYYKQKADRTNDFQLLLVDRSNVGAPGDFDIVLNYNRVTWEFGDASSGISAGAGFSAGDGDAGHFYDRPGSRVNGAFLDSNANGLARTSTNSTVVGRHVYPVRDGGVAGVTPPDVVISVAPPTATNNPSPTITYTSRPASESTTFECRLQPRGAATASFQACPPGGFETGTLPEGTYTVDVRATDVYGLTDPTPASTTFTVDTTAPGGTQVSGPSGVLTERQAQFTFASPGDADVAGHQCRISPAPAGGAVGWSTCTSPVTFGDLVDGEYTLDIRAVDAAGNTGPMSSRSFEVDATPPGGVESTGTSGPVNQSTATFSWPGIDDAVSYECRIAPVPAGGVAGWTTCTSPVSFEDLADGDYTVRVRAVDAAGNRGEATVHEFTVDTAPPAALDPATPGSGPTGTTSDTSPTFSWTGPQDAASYECRITPAPAGTSGGWSTCTSPVTFGDLVDGEYTLDIRAVDAAGNTG
ncbi:Ig-like domain-containing protein, partial [Nocardioides hwasunensis]